VETKLNNIQLENIKQILTLRYSTNLENLSLPLQSNNIQNSIIDTPEIFIEKSIRETISDQVKNKNEKIGISLSSGIDSTLILALLREEFPSIEIESLSIKFSESVDETENSKKISEKFETNHHVLEINNFFEELPKAISIVKQPFWDLHWYYLVKKMKSFSNIFFSGDGGDELFGGYTFRYKKFLELTTENSSVHDKIFSYLNCHERDWVPDQENLFGKNCSFDWKNIYKILEPHFGNSLPRLSQVFLADYNGKLRYNMQPLYSKIHNFFNMKNVTPIQNKDLLQFAFKLNNNLKYNFENNSGKIPLVKILKRFDVMNLISSKKQGFSVNTLNLWNSIGYEIFQNYFDKSRLIEDHIINFDWVQKHLSKNITDVRYANKFLGLIALEIWYRLFISNDINSNQKL
jgi:asparagine synthase (glutamine-hydrolysing)